MKKEIKFEKTELSFLIMVLNDFITSPYIKRGSGFRPYAFNLLRKLNGKPIFEKELRKEYNKYIQKIVRKRLTQYCGKPKEVKNGRKLY